MISLSLSEIIDVPLDIVVHLAENQQVDSRARGSSYLLCHLINVTRRSIVHHRVREHERNVTPVLDRGCDLARSDAGLDRLEVDGSMDERLVVGCIRRLDWLVEDRAAFVLVDLLV
jgi:hypothetical protein